MTTDTSNDDFAARLNRQSEQIDQLTKDNLSKLYGQLEQNSKLISKRHENILEIFGIGKEMR